MSGDAHPGWDSKDSDCRCVACGEDVENSHMRRWINQNRLCLVCFSRLEQNLNCAIATIQGEQLDKENE